jgi:hypothetical protein
VDAEKCIAPTTTGDVMTIKIDNQEPNIFSLVEGIDVRDAGRSADPWDQSRWPIGDRDHQVELCAS